MTTTVEPDLTGTRSYRWSTPSVRTGTAGSRDEPGPVGGNPRGLTHRLDGSRNDNETEETERRVLDSITQPRKGEKIWSLLSGLGLEGYPLKKDHTWESIENLYGH